MMLAPFYENLFYLTHMDHWFLSFTPGDLSLNGVILAWRRRLFVQFFVAPLIDMQLLHTTSCALSEREVGG